MVRGAEQRSRPALVSLRNAAQVTADVVRTETTDNERTRAAHRDNLIQSVLIWSPQRSWAEAPVLLAAALLLARYPRDGLDEEAPPRNCRPVR